MLSQGVKDTAALARDSFGAVAIRPGKAIDLIAYITANNQSYTTGSSYRVDGASVHAITP